MIGLAGWEGILDGLGWLVAEIYNLVLNYGVTIIVLTIIVRIVLLPLGVKQIRSMHAMQSLQPKIKAIQAKHKNDKQKAGEETMKLYREHGVSPLGGCLPLLLQMPILFALYAVLRYPVPEQNMHVPQGSKLQVAMREQSPGVHFLGANLLCSASQAGNGNIEVSFSANEKLSLNCGTGLGAKIPLYAFIVLMVGSTYFQQWQMQRASPPGAVQKQQQMITRLMPAIFLIFFWRYPAGLVLYWSMSSVWQIGQQHFLLSAIKREREEAEKSGTPVVRKERKPGYIQRLMEQGTEARRQQEDLRTGKGGPKERGEKKPGGQRPAPGESEAKKPGGAQGEPRKTGGGKMAPKKPGSKNKRGKKPGGGRGGR